MRKRGMENPGSPQSHPKVTLPVSKVCLGVMIDAFSVFHEALQHVSRLCGFHVLPEAWNVSVKHSAFVLFVETRSMTGPTILPVGFCISGSERLSAESSHWRREEEEEEGTWCSKPFFLPGSPFGAPSNQTEIHRFSAQKGSITRRCTTSPSESASGWTSPGSARASAVACPHGARTTPSGRLGGHRVGTEPAGGRGSLRESGVGGQSYPYTPELHDSLHSYSFVSLFLLGTCLHRRDLEHRASRGSRPPNQ